MITKPRLLNGFLLLVFVLCTAVFIRFLLNAISFLEDESSTRLIGRAFATGVLALLSLFFLFSLTRSTALKINLSVSLITFAIAFPVIDLVLGPPISGNEQWDQDRQKVAAYLDVPFDKRALHEVLTDLKADNGNSYPSIHPSLFRSKI